MRPFSRSGEPPLPERGYQLQLSARGLTPQPPQTPTPLAAGTALTNAPPLTADVPVRDTIRVGETAWYAIDVPQGSRFGAVVLAGGGPGRGAGRVHRIRLRGPRQSRWGQRIVCFGFSFDGRKAAGDDTASSSSEAVGVTSSKTSRIAEAGQYFITVNLKQGFSCTGKIPLSDLQYPVRLVAQVAPFVPKASATPTPNATPNETPTAAATDAAPPTSNGGTNPWVWVAIGVLLLAAAVVAMVVVLNKRNRPVSGPPPAGWGPR